MGLGDSFGGGGAGTPGGLPCPGMVFHGGLAHVIHEGCISLVLFSKINDIIYILFIYICAYVNKYVNSGDDDADDDDDGDGEEADDEEADDEEADDDDDDTQP
jgi:hypothetical protein